MKRIMELFIVLLFLLSACVMPARLEPVAQTQSVPSLITTSLSTFTPQSQAPSKAPFCQGEPEYVRLGTATNIIAFSLPANQSLRVYLGSKLVATGTANMDGYANIEVFIPVNETVGLHQISIYATGTDPIVTCQIQLWSDSIPSPTLLPVPTLTPKPTLSSGQLTMTATRQTLQERLGKYCWSGSASGAKLSPDARWVEVNCEPDVIKIVAIDESKIWDVSSSELIYPYSEHFVSVFHWSNDGLYVYAFVNPHTDGYWEPFHQGIVLYRLTLQTGQFSEVLPLGKGDWVFYAFSFSPNDRRLAYIVTDKSPAILNVRDMQSGVEQSYTFDGTYNTGGGFLWSPDSQNLVFSITQYDPNNHKYIATSIGLWNREKSNIVTLVKDHEEVLVPIEWVDETKILLQVLYENDRKFEFDLRSNELKQISP
jgi:hypothetical protein